MVRAIPPEFGSYLPPRDTRSCVLKKDNAIETTTPWMFKPAFGDLESEEGSGVKYIKSLGFPTRTTF
ncbi:unnamed protein product [Prunus armeniaca]|uniref:Uncharacterized protein n=1 Tax=Prunus armeniaca TaxID=36596 RepID=A0A6J5Y024_PRUAR|nr:unnamed protein product [Prunus armeniaca]